MTRIKQNGALMVQEEPEGRCEFCGEEKETRPYGPDGKEICFKCAMGTPEGKEEAEKRFERLLED